jgi:DNA-binding XRE family transcriptional regulator
MGVAQRTVINWENDAVAPELRYLPVIITFLGYDPRPMGETLGESIRMAREREGISQRQLARRFGLGATTVGAWENGKMRHPWPRLARLFEEYVAGA